MTNKIFEEDDFSVSDTGCSEEKNPYTPNRSRTYDLLVTSPDALPLKATGDWWELRPLN